MAEQILRSIKFSNSEDVFVIPDAPSNLSDLNGVLEVNKGGTGLSSVTAGNFLVGNGTEDMVEKSPSEVLEIINGASIATITTAEYEALEEAEATNANTLYMLTDAEEEEEVLITVDDIDTICGSTIQAASEVTF